MLTGPIEAVLAKIPCIFPGEQGNEPRDEFAADCLHRQVVLVFTRFSSSPRARDEIRRSSRGFGDSGFEKAVLGDRTKSDRRPVSGQLSLLDS